mgnify:CR=1 FL=1
MNFSSIKSFSDSMLERFNLNYFFGQPQETKTFWFLLIIVCIFVLFVLSYYIYLYFKSKKNIPYKLYSRTFLWPNLLMSVLFLMHLFGRYENLVVFSWRFWMYLIITSLITFNGWFFVKRKNQLDDEILVLADQIRKQKWLKSRKKQNK